MSAAHPNPLLPATPAPAPMPDPVLPSSGPAPVGIVVTTSKPWYTSLTIWSSLSMVGGAVLDAVISVLVPLLSTDAPFDPQRLWRPCLVAAFGAIVAYRRKNDNTVIQ